MATLNRLGYTESSLGILKHLDGNRFLRVDLEEHGGGFDRIHVSIYDLATKEDITVNPLVRSEEAMIKKYFGLQDFTEKVL